MRKFFDWLLTSRSGDLSSIKKEAERLPDIMPADFKIRLAEFEISNKTVVVNHSSEDTERNFQFALTAGQMERLFRILKENKFDRIKIMEDTRLDAGSEFIHVSWGNTFISKGSSQAYYIHKKWEAQYHECNYQLVQLLREAVTQYLKPLKIIPADELTVAGQNYCIRIHDSLTPYFYSGNHGADSFEGLPVPKHSTLTHIIPGYTELTVSRLIQGSSRERIKLRVYFPEGNYDSLTLHIYPEGDQVRYTMEFS